VPKSTHVNQTADSVGKKKIHQNNWNG
jgi:hypothetical protein